MSDKKIKITMLGGFEVTVNGQPAMPLLEQSRKAMLLVQYLLLKRGSKITHKELIDAVWGNDNSVNPDMALRAITHRYRLMAAGTPLETSIRTTRGAYEWNMELGADIDIYTMLDMLDKADAATGPERRIRLYSDALDLYGGKLLPASAGESWVERRSVQIHTRYRTSLFVLLELYKDKQDYNAVIARCRRGLEIDAYDERLYIELILALEELGQAEEAEAVTRHAIELGCLHEGQNPKNMQTSYARIRRTETANEGDIVRIADNIAAGNENRDAYCCDYSVFREIFRVQMRLYVRYGVAPFLALATVDAPQGSTEAEVADAMKLLESIILKTLRCSDVLAQYTANQYVLMLFGGSDMTAGHPMERIKTEFYRRPEHGNMGLSYRLHTPELPATEMEIIKNNKKQEK